MSVTGKCDVKKCRRMGEFIYYDKDVCLHHWEMHCRENSRFDLRKEFKIPFTKIKIKEPVEEVKQDNYSRRRSLRRLFFGGF